MKRKEIGPKEYQSKDNRPVIVRRATPKDLSKYISNFAAVAKEGIYTGTEIVGEAQKKRIADGLKDPRSLTIVANFGNEGIVGSLNLSPFRDLKKMAHVRLLGMIIIDGYRESGIGSALMDYGIKWARKQDEIEKISLSVFSTNKRAIGLYKKFGFKIEGRLERQFILKGKYADEIEMGLILRKKRV
ncbi:MAG: GNAT family N-acetyltransferase [Nitrososphaerales archaeon]